VRTLLFRIVQVAVGVALFAYVLSLASPAELRDAIAGADVPLLVIAGLINIPITLLFGLRSSFVLAQLGHRVDPRTAVPIAIVGNVAGALTPASSGELIRGVLLHTRAEVAAHDAAALVLYERGFSVYLIMLTTGAAALMLVLPLAAMPVVIASVVALVFVPGLILASAGSWLQRRLDRRSGRAFARAARDGIASLTDLARHRGLSARWDAVTAAIIAVTALQYWLVARSLNGGITYTEAWVSFGASQLAGIVSLLPLGLGSSDATLISLWRRYGLSYDAAASGAVLIRLVSTLPLIAIAVISYAYLRTRRTAPRQPADEPVRASTNT